MRATVDDRSLAVMNGANPNRASQASWIIGTQLAALAGILVAPKLNLSALPLTLLIVNAYAAAMIGRLRSLPMTFVGALILGLANDLVVGYLPKIKTGQQYISGFGAVTPVFVAAAGGVAAQADQAARQLEGAHPGDQPDPDRGAAA